MANKALEEINDKITKLQDEKRVAQEAFRAFADNHAKKVAEYDQALADWAEVLDSYWTRKPAAKTAAKKTAGGKP